MHYKEGDSPKASYRYKFIGNLWAGKQAVDCGLFKSEHPPFTHNREAMQILIKKVHPDFAVITDFELYRVEETNATHTITDNKGVPLEVTVTT